MKTAVSRRLREFVSHSFVILPFLFYGITCAPSIGLGDTALLVDGIKTLKINTHVNNHNLTVLIGWLFQLLPIGDIAYRANLSSAFAGGATVALFYWVLYKIFESRPTASVSAMFLMISHSMWWHSTISEVYAVNAFFTVAAIGLFWFLDRSGNEKFLFGLFFVSGLALFNHILMGALAVGAAAALLCAAVEKPKNALRLFGLSTLCFTIGALPYLLTLLKDAHMTRNFSQTVSFALGGQFKTLMFKGGVWRGLSDFLFLVFMQFPSPYLFAVPAGIILFAKQGWLRARKSLAGIFTVFFTVAGFFMFYNTWDKFAFLLPAFVILAFWGAFAVDRFLKFVTAKRSLFLNVHLAAAILLSGGINCYLYSNLSRWGIKPDSPWYGRYNNYYTHNIYRVNEYIANPNKRRYRDISEYCELLFQKLPRNSVYFDDDSRAYHTLALYYQRYYQRRLDIDIQMINSWGFQNWGNTRAGFQNRVQKAFLNNEDFFVVSLGRPFDEFLSDEAGGSKFRFARFPLDEKRWIYKLVTARDVGEPTHNRIGRSTELDLKTPLLIDLALENVLNYSGGIPIFQENMAAFGGNWRNDDQVFFRATEKNAEIGFILKCGEAGTANLRIHLTTAPDYGIIDVFLNDKPLPPEPVDLYTANVAAKTLDFSSLRFEKGNNILLFRVVGSNPKSTGMKLGVDSFEISGRE